MNSTRRPDANKQLIYYIALSAPPTRTPATGEEPFLRPEVGFNPSWFHLHCGVDFSERWHLDPDYRLRCHELMTREIRRRFPGRAIGGAEKDEPPDLLTGLFAGAVVAAIYGQSIMYFPDKWPVAHGDPLSDEQAMALTPADLSRSAFMDGILRQMDRIEQLTGTIRGFLNWQGVLNTAFRLRGHQIFIDLLENPSLAEHVFRCIAETMVKGMRLVYERQRQAGQTYNFASVSNCVVNMISPQLYHDRLLPFDAWIRDQFPVFGIHNCAWRVDPYLDSYREIPEFGYLDMGLESDLGKARKLFPEARRNVLLTSMYLSSRSDEGVRADLERIAAELGPCDLGLPDVEIDVPDARILYILDLCQELSERFATVSERGAASIEE
ncbi:MAG TPA: hypothetical protein PLP42_02500 [Acidobacteriota bacterium]|nr:hypothetical protein [Acidobacteriota bacterium]